MKKFTGGPGRPYVRLDGVASMRSPGTKRCFGVEEVQLVVRGKIPPADTAKEPPDTVHFVQGGIHGLDLVNEDPLEFPLMGKMHATVQFYGIVMLCLRNHVQVPTPFKQKGIRQMIVSLENYFGLFPCSMIVHFNDGYMALHCFVQELFQKYVVIASLL
jgi:hypothetical protein